MTRILMTADAVGGVWTYALELARALDGDGLSTTLATMGPRPTETQCAAAASVPNLDLQVGDFPLEWMIDAERVGEGLANAGRWLLDLEARIAPAIVHLNGFVHGALPFQAPAVVVGHSCLLSWREANGGRFEATSFDAYRTAVTAGLRAAASVVAPTTAMLQALQRHYGPLPRATVIANGRSADAVPRPRHKEPIVATAGRLWDPAKNAAAVADVSVDLEWPVTFAGSAEQHAPQEPQDEVLAVLARSSIFALPARYEPFGLLPLEAALAGCALVLGAIDSLREVWADAAMYVDPDDRSALRSTLQSLIGDADLRADMAARARRRAERYTPAAMARSYMEVYTSVGAVRQCA
jgi:glycosyltransferase involved in cell wall biosynthesis